MENTKTNFPTKELPIAGAVKGGGEAAGRFRGEYRGEKGTGGTWGRMMF